MYRMAAIVISLAALCSLSGCLVHSSSRTEYSGRYIGSETIKQIEPGKTKDDFVLAVLGAPTSKTQLSDGAEVWKWEYQKKKSSSGSVFLLVDADNHTESRGATYIVIRTGTVEKIWQD